MHHDPYSIERTTWSRRTMYLGGLALAVVLVLLPFSPQHGCVKEVKLWSSPILVLEFLASPQETQLLFGTEPACKVDLEHKFKVVNTIDYLFMLAYGAFLFAGLLATRSRDPQNSLQPRKSFVPLIAAVLAPIADAVENFLLLTSDFRQPNAPFGTLRLAVATKFTLLAVVSAVLAKRVWSDPTQQARWTAGLHALALPIVILSLIDTHRFLVLLQAPFVLSWVTLLVWAISHRRPLSLRT